MQRSTSRGPSAPAPTSWCMGVLWADGRFLHGVLSYTHPSRAVIDESEKDATPFLSK